MRSKQNILSLPVYAISVFTQAKSFKANPVVGSQTLNKLGLHVIRMLMARGVFNLKLMALSSFASKQDRAEFKKNGYLIKENFLPQEEFAALLGEVRNYNGEIRQNIQGDTIVYRKFLDKETLAHFPHCKKYIENDELMNVLKYTSGKNERPRLYIEQLRTGEGNTSKPDPQKNLHSDTFHPTVKSWLFLDDVTDENSPFNYVKGSNRLSWRRIKWEYKRSIAAKDLNDGYSEKGSFRAFDSDLQELGLPQPTPLKVKANTLVIANTNGFHKRGEGKAGSKRLTLWTTSRANPFNPWPGLGIEYLSQIRDEAFSWYQKLQDKKAIQKGKKPSWHTINGKF